MYNVDWNEVQHLVRDCMDVLRKGASRNKAALEDATYSVEVAAEGDTLSINVLYKRSKLQHESKE